MATVETPLYRAVISSGGGRLQEWVIHYRGEKPMVVFDALGPEGLMVQRAGAQAQTIPFHLSAEHLRLGKDTPSGELRLTGEDGFGLRVTEILRFEADSYLVERQIKVENRHTVAQGVELVLSWSAPLEWPKDQAERFQGQRPVRVVRVTNGTVRREDLANIGDLSGDGQWVGLESEWYLSALIPKSPGFTLTGGKGSGSVRVGLRVVLPQLLPGQSWDGRVLVYAGPKEYDRLKALGVGLEKSIYFGGFPLPEGYGGLPMEWISVPILWLMNFFYSYTRNYGVAIILLTVITKILFYPLTMKSLSSMKAMQAIQPQVNALRSKHKNDSQRLQRETMELYRKHRVNPLGGCLPMVIQIPIFYALYVALSVSVEMQNAKFLCLGRIFGMDLWICDLAQQDPTYVLPILMGATMFIQQKMTPTMGDPRQAKMMLIMPFVFTFMFLSLPSGLVLYWTVSNVLQILQQHYMDRQAKGLKSTGKATKGA
jgi:YidC/Oxa1 family membrane protein insertase